MRDVSQQDSTPAEKPAGAGIAKHGRLLRSALVMTLMTALSRVLGLTRDILMAGLLGTSMAMDAYRVASIIPNTLRRLLGEGAMTAAFVPTFAEVENRAAGDRAKVWRFASTFFCTFTLVLLIVAGLGIIFSPQIVDIFAEKEFAEVAGKIALTVELNRIVFPYIALVSMAAMLTAVLNSLGSFAPSAFTPVLLNIAIIVCGWSFAYAFISPAHGFVIGFVVGGLAQVLFQIPFLRPFGFHFSFRISFTDPMVRQVFRLMIPGIFAVGITQINVMITTRILTGLQEGSAAGMYYANRLNELTLGLFAISIATVILPTLSRQAEARDFSALKSTLTFAVRMISFITIPATVGLLVLNRPIVSILFERGEFDATSLDLTAGPLLYYSIGLIFFALIRTIVPAFYALKLMKIPVMIGVADMATNVTAAYLLAPWLGNAGVALALTCGAIVNVCLLLTVFTVKFGTIDFAGLTRSLVRIGLAALIMGGVCWGISAAVGLETMVNGLAKILWTFAAIGAGILVYIGAGYALHSEEMRELAGLVQRKLGRGKR